ncbi:Protein SSO2 [Lachnellula occidentalis]|uniref:Protein SSO2 n=1 Tax=Lachnellula occidentalis TaxID=215460 RepID=A0A8H8U9W0_9HELO|nr:Protein SSO2 [Lachnellula occidentalis]
MAQYGYGGGGANPYDQRTPEQGGYGAQPYRQQSPQYSAPAIGGRDEYSDANEMEHLTTNGAQFSGHDDPAAHNKETLAQCDRIDREVKDLAGPRSEELRTLQMNILNSPDPGATLTNQRNQASDAMMQEYIGLVDVTRRLKSDPRNSSNKVVGKVGRDLETAMKGFRKLDYDYTIKLREQSARQYRIVRPEASEAEVEEALASQSNQQVFSQALMQSNRRGQAQSVMSAVQSRHEDIKRIESQMNELAQLFIDLDTLVVQQEAPIANIEMKSEEVVENMDKGNAQIGTAIQSARNTRKWKWWCLGIVVLIIVIIVIIVLIYKFVIQNNNSSSSKPASKRFVLPSLERRVISAPTEERSDVPGLKWTRENTLAPVEERWVVDKLEWSPPSKKERRFQA